MWNRITETATELEGEKKCSKALKTTMRCGGSRGGFRGSVKTSKDSQTANVGRAERHVAQKPVSKVNRHIVGQPAACGSPGVERHDSGITS